jgi:chemotaxis family two-component system sensor kinase Cph1
MLFEEQARAAGLIFEFAVDEDCPDVLVFDPLRVRQILVNLLSNAIKFTSRGSIRGFIWATSFREGKCDLAFSVQDTGRGIASDKMELVFQPFRQAEVSDETLGGTGLGLSICHELAALMGGEIEVSSEVGVGTEFLLILQQVEIVDLPGALPKDVTAIQTDFNELPPSRVLVADDNQFNIELISGYFEGSHHHLEYRRERSGGAPVDAAEPARHRPHGHPDAGDERGRSVPSHEGGRAARVDSLSSP